MCLSRRGDSRITPTFAVIPDPVRLQPSTGKPSSWMPVFTGKHLCECLCFVGADSRTVAPCKYVCVSQNEPRSRHLPIDSRWSLHCRNEVKNALDGANPSDQRQPAGPWRAEGLLSTPSTTLSKPSELGQRLGNGLQPAGLPPAGPRRRRAG